jgi:hypothetical protein
LIRRGERRGQKSDAEEQKASSAVPGLQKDVRSFHSVGIVMCIPHIVKDASPLHFSSTFTSAHL